MNEKLLSDLAAAGAKGWISADKRAPFDELVAAGLMSTDGIVDDEGDILYSLTEMGLNWLTANKAAAPAAPEPLPAQHPPVEPIVPSNGFDMDEAAWNTPHRVRKAVNPILDTVIASLDLESAPIGGSKHIPVTDAVPKPWETYYKAVALVNRRHATPKIGADGKPVTVERKSRKDSIVRLAPVFDYFMRFTIYRAKKDDPRGEGARIKRVE